jgi:hypothetical protein
MNMYYVHEYSDEQFEAYEECRDDLYEQIDEDDVNDHIDLTVPEIIHQFCRRANNQNFINWFEEKIAEAERLAVDELITEYEEGEVE